MMESIFILQVFKLGFKTTTSGLPSPKLSQLSYIKGRLWAIAILWLTFFLCLLIVYPESNNSVVIVSYDCMAECARSHMAS